MFVIVMQAASQAEAERLSGQLQEAIVAAEVGRAKVLLYDELTKKAEKLVRELPERWTNTSHMPLSTCCRAHRCTATKCTAGTIYAACCALLANSHISKQRCTYKLTSSKHCAGGRGVAVVRR